MSLPIQVQAHSGYKANERPLRFTLDDDTYEITQVEDQWYSPDALFFRVLTPEGKRFVLRYDERDDAWTLQIAFDGDALLLRPGIELVSAVPKAIREAQRRVVGCEACRRQEAEIRFDWLLAKVLNKDGPYEFVLAEVARCPACGEGITEKTLVVLDGGLEAAAPV